MADSAKTIEISILGRNYKIACEEGERAGAAGSGRLPRRQDGRRSRSAGKVSGTDRIAVMAALNIAHEFLSIKLGERL